MTFFDRLRFARGTRANRYAPLGARRRSGVGQVTTAVHSREGTKFPRAPLPHPACGLCGGPFRLVRLARETRTNRYAPLGARHRSCLLYTSYNFKHRFNHATVEYVFRWVLKAAAEEGYLDTYSTVAWLNRCLKL